MSSRGEILPLAGDERPPSSRDKDPRPPLARDKLPLPGGERLSPGVSSKGPETSTRG